MWVADLLSLVRIPLGLVFLGVAGRPWIAAGVMAVAGLTDIADGWVARRHRKPGDTEHHRGDWLDPLCDKLFVGAVVVGIYLAQRPPLFLLLLLLTREILQTVAVSVMRLIPTLHRVSRDYDFKAHPVGKATTVVQFLTGIALLFGNPAAVYAAGLAAGLGTVTVGIYVNRLRGLLPPEAPGS
jgi:cardiolipin synthase (CMP-forming)